MQVARDEKIQEVVADVLLENFVIRALSGHFDFKIRESDDPGIIVGGYNSLNPLTTMVIKL